MKSTPTCVTPEILQKLSCDQLTVAELQQLESHLDDCPRCREELDVDGSDDLWQQLIAPALRSSTELSGHGTVDSEQCTNQPLDAVIQLLGPTDDPRMLGRVGTYEIVGVIGRGGMGVVFKAFDAALNRYVAIKMLLPHLAETGASRKRFAREGQAAAAVIDDHVMPIYSVAEWQGVPYLVMQYSRGSTLQKRVEEQGPLELKEILRIGMQTARGLAAAHAQGLVHRDVKPSNILIDGTVERALLTDFGLARTVDDVSITRNGVIAGTPQYMSPEQATGGTVDARSDLFSLGSVLYFLGTGRQPFHADNTYAILRQIIDQEPRNMQGLNPELPVWLCKLISHLMAKDPDARPATAQEVAEMLQRCLAHLQQPTIVALPSSIQGPTVAPKHQTTSRPFKLGLVIGLAILIGFLGAFAFLQRSQDQDRLPAWTTPPQPGSKSQLPIPPAPPLSSEPAVNSSEDDAVFRPFDSGSVAEGAALTWRKYVEWWNVTQGTPLKPVAEIPRSAWATPIIRLDPKYVYAHGVNVVIVRSQEEDSEEGIYVTLAISSSPGPNDEQFTRTFIAHASGGNVYTFRRKGRLERVAP